MNIERINEFIVLSKVLNYSKAADMLFISQPALSKHIHELEVSLGVELFERNTHKMRLTAVGEIFFDEAVGIVKKYNHALAAIEKYQNESPKHLSFGFLGAATQNFLSKFIMDFSSKHPDLTLSFYTDRMDELVYHILEDDLDVAMVTIVDEKLSADVQSKHIQDSKLYMVCHPDNPLAKFDSVSLGDISEYPMIDFNRKDLPYNWAFNRHLFELAGTSPKIAIEVDHIDTALLPLSTNAGYFLAPQYLMHIFPSEFVKKPIADSFASVPLNLIWKKNHHNPLVDLFVTEFSAFLKKNHKS